MASGGMMPDDGRFGKGLDRALRKSPRQMFHLRRTNTLMKVVVQVTTGATDAESRATFAPGVPAVVGDRGQASGRKKVQNPAAL